MRGLKVSYPDWLNTETSGIIAYGYKSYYSKCLGGGRERGGGEEGEERGIRKRRGRRRINLVYQYLYIFSMVSYTGLLFHMQNR